MPADIIKGSPLPKGKVTTSEEVEGRNDAWMQGMLATTCMLMSEMMRAQMFISSRGRTTARKTETGFSGIWENPSPFAWSLRITPEILHFCLEQPCT